MITIIIIMSLLRSNSYDTKLSPPLLDYLTIIPALSTNDPLWFVCCARSAAATAGCRGHDAGEYLRWKPRQLPAFACVCVRVESHLIVPHGQSQVDGHGPCSVCFVCAVTCRHHVFEAVRVCVCVCAYKTTIVHCRCLCVRAYDIQ